MQCELTRMPGSHQRYGDTSVPGTPSIRNLQNRPLISGRRWVCVLLALVASTVWFPDAYSMESVALSGSIERRIDRSELDHAFATSNRVSFASKGTERFAFRASVDSLDSPCGRFRNNPSGVASLLGISTGANECEILGELSGKWQWRNGSIAVGRQRLETPHIATDESLAVPNTFESVALTYDATDNISFSAYYVGAMADYDFKSSRVGFASLGGGFGSEIGNSAAIIAASYVNQKFAVKGWYYFIEDIENILYLEFSHANRLSLGLEYSFDLQYSRAVDIGGQGLDKIDSRAAGIAANLQWTGIEFHAAYNLESGTTTTPSSIGGGPFFTSMAQQSIDSISGEEGRAMLTGVSYSPQHGPLAGLELSLAAGRFTAAKHNDYDIKEIDLGLSYQSKEAIRLDLNYSRLIDRAASENDDRFAVIVSVPF